MHARERLSGHKCTTLLVVFIQSYTNVNDNVPNIIIPKQMVPPHAQQPGPCTHARTKQENCRYTADTSSPILRLASTGLGSIIVQQHTRGTEQGSGTNNNEPPRLIVVVFTLTRTTKTVVTGTEGSSHSGVVGK